MSRQSNSAFLDGEPPCVALDVLAYGGQVVTFRIPVRDLEHYSSGYHVGLLRLIGWVLTGVLGDVVGGPGDRVLSTNDRVSDRQTYRYNYDGAPMPININHYLPVADVVARDDHVSELSDVNSGILNFRALFKNAYIPRTPNQVFVPERDVEKLDKGEGDSLTYNTVDADSKPKVVVHFEDSRDASGDELEFESDEEGDEKRPRVVAFKQQMRFACENRPVARVFVTAMVPRSLYKG
ncbi:hypothetical protein AURDEDRAFT_160015 [Auricularia subglabra TFB-10046 SS5]|nr:hypothetical protein AURDEDRAFT_160015 [Auricularia subglabra TFB-10046 SS5]